MTEKDLKKLNRYQLLELLIAQTERADRLQQQLEEAQQALKDKELKLSSLGSIAEAAMELTGIREDRTGGELTWTLGADSTETVQPEAYWQLEVFRRGRWSTLGPEPWPVPGVLNPMKPGESRVYILNWADCAGALEPGYYRITQDLVRYQAGSTPEHRKCCVRFEIR